VETLVSNIQNQMHCAEQETLNDRETEKTDMEGMAL
jgi:hypothetical protein